MATIFKPEIGYGTEYTENYNSDRLRGGAGSRNASLSGLFDGKTLGTPMSYPVGPAQTDPRDTSRFDPGATGDSRDAMEIGATETRDPSVFPSQIYPSEYRETVIHKDDRGKYIDPFSNIANKPYGRRLMYDPSHPDKMYPSQWSSELADHPGCYSFPTTTGLDPEIPFKQDLHWQAEAEEGSWPTDLWKNWTQVACCPPYDGHDDQVEYSKYKVQVP